MSLEEQNGPRISLGFTEEKFRAGVHICQIYNTDEERQDSLLSYLLSGLQSKERVCCFSDKTKEQEIMEFLGEHGLSPQEIEASQALTVATTRGIYFQDDRFDPNQLLDRLARFHEESIYQGYTAARVIGEMTPEIKNVPGGSRLLEYESKVSLLLQNHPITSVCQYDARAFDGAMILDILKVHPLMVVKGSVVRNPYFIAPEQFLAQAN